ncbi:MAG: glycosyltransferase [Chthoniobacterales bacterium]
MLEAFAAGLPVVTSNTTSLPEVAGDAAILVDPRDVAAIAQGMRSCLNDDDRRCRRWSARGGRGRRTSLGSARRI